MSRIVIPGQADAALVTPGAELVDAHGKPIKSKPPANPRQARPQWHSSFRPGEIVTWKGHVFEMAELAPGGVVMVYRGPSKRARKERTHASKRRTH